ncbi:SatD family protein [Kaarinaea lacus]
MNKIVVIADIVSSRKIEQRAALQKKLKAVIRQVNRKNPNLVSPYTITLGDEFQAVLNKADHLFFDFTTIMEALHPERVRFSISVGEINTPINRQQAIGMDGPAFYAARHGIETLKSNEYLFTCNGLNENQQNLVNQSLYLASHHLLKWKLSRLSIFNYLQQNFNVLEISNKVSLGDKAIYKSIDQGALKVVDTLFRDIEQIINQSLKPKKRK